MAKDEPSWSSISCARGRRRWYGVDRAHCPACHRTFADTDIFDRYRVDHDRTNPVELGMIKDPKPASGNHAPPTTRRRLG